LSKYPTIFIIIIYTVTVFSANLTFFWTCPGQNATFLTVEWSMSACH